MTFWQGLKSTYCGSLAFMIACPLLALVPVLFELVQHGVEVHISMYDSIALARAAEHDPLRVGFGFLKIVALTVPIYWVNRFLASRDASFARRVSSPALRLFAVLLLVELALAGIQYFVLPQAGWAALASLVGGHVVACLLAAWAVAAPLGNATVGPLASMAIMIRQLPWTFVFTVAAILPLMISHYALASIAFVGPKALLWPVLIVDSLLVGWLAVVIIACSFFAAIRAATKAGVALVPPLEALPA
jgi:hypothetical protein